MSAGTSRKTFGEDLGESVHVFWQRGLVCSHGLAVPLADYFQEGFVRVSSPSDSSLTCCFPLGLVKAINTAVDLIVAHFGTSRDPGVKVCLASNSILSGTESTEQDCLSVLFMSKTTGYLTKAGVPRTIQTKVMAHHAADSKSVTIPAA